MMEQLTRELASNQEAACDRPVLRGNELPGNALRDVDATLDPAGPLAACMESVAAHSLGRALASCPTPDDDGLSRRADTPCGLRFYAGPVAEPRDAAIIELAVAPCGSLPAVLSRAVRHRDGCSPARVGLRPPASVASYRLVALASAGLARHLAAAGHAATGMRLLFDAIRLGQDLGRGGVCFQVGMETTAAMDVLLVTANWILSKECLPREDLAPLEREAQRLFQTEPHFTEFLWGDYLYNSLYRYWPTLEPPGWQPPGGWVEEPRAPEARAPYDATIRWQEHVRRADEYRVASLEPVLDPRDERALRWLTFRKSYDDFVSSHCPPRASIRRCLDASPLLSIWMPRSIREGIVHWMRGFWPPPEWPFLGPIAFRAARLGAQRLHLAALRQGRGGQCPTAGDYQTDPRSALQAAASLTERLRAVVGSEELDLLAERRLRWLLPATGDLWRVQCPQCVRDGARRAQ